MIDEVEGENLMEVLAEAENDARVARAAAKQKTREAAAQLAKGAAASSHEGAGEFVGCTKVLKPPTDVVSIDFARAHMPHGYSIAFEPESSSYWVNSKFLKGRRSRVVGPLTGETHWSAFKFVCTLAWESHTSRTGQKCPFLFE